MKNILTKLSYMALGRLLTLIGYHFGNIENNTADAQGLDVQEKIFCRSLAIVDENNVPRIFFQQTPC